MTDAAPDETGEAESPEAKPNWRRELEAKARQADELAAKVAEFERRDVFRDAGIDLSGMGRYFMEGYKGDLSVEAIQAEAEKVGLLGQPTAPAQQPAVDTSVEDRIHAVADSAQPPPNEDLIGLIRQTGNEEELRRVMEAHGYLWNAKV